ncbi:hypothetical protein TNCT_232291 [Trichonephila clavata]|uniref:Uncharacterized protein n=1 Tax=Trichonephila clavata TaxID=2740835 RepID=A0A8X6JBL2_TRICU|nr:hypothetical protein TNCT_79701 [Trichonephila clavata]GFR00381.1 hypothetical protein TNCT_232291 [Trichonephila clavata]
MQVPEADRDPVGEGDFGIVTDRPVLAFFDLCILYRVLKDERESWISCRFAIFDGFVTDFMSAGMEHFCLTIRSR